MSKPNLRIPEYFHAGLKRLIHLNPDQAVELTEALAKEQPKYFAQQLATQVAKKTRTIPPDDVTEIIRVLNALYSVSKTTEVSATEFVEALCDAAERLELKPSDDALWTRFKSTLEQILSDDGALAVAAKASNVISEYDRIFYDVRILTDIRPVFRVDARERPAAMAAIHTLRLSFHQNGDWQMFFLAMDNKDLAKLKSAITRAEEKAANIAGIIAETQIPVLESGRDDIW